MVELWAEPRHPEISLRPGPLDLEPRRAPGVGRRQGKPLESAAWQPPERAFRRRQHLRGDDGSDDDQHERLGDVVLAIEADERLAREPLDELRGSDHRSAVGVSVEQELVELPPETATRVVLPQPDLLEHDT